MAQFRVSTHVNELTGPYPNATDLLQLVGRIGPDDREAIVRLWVSEGIPFAFREVPALYEGMRDCLGQRLSAHPKTITLVGSGRLGTSLAPPPDTGKYFGAHSDLDWSAVSEMLFDQCSYEFKMWATEYRNRTVHPRNERELAHWDDNLHKVPDNISRGFIDPYKIPSWTRYPTAQRVAQTLWYITQTLKATPEAPKFTKASLRVYRDWSSFVRQISLNLKTASRRYIEAVK